MTGKRQGLSLLICLFLIISILTQTVYADSDADGTPVYEPTTNDIAGWPVKQPIYGQSCVLMDMETGAVLCSRERETMRYPASTTKVLTCLLALENLSLDDTLTMTEEGVALATDGSSNCASVVGEEFSVKDALYMLMLKSANDIATQFAVQIAGSTDAFADMMNARAESIGCTGSHFHNPSGMPDDEHYTTAMDLARIFREAYKNEMFRTLISTLNYTVPPTNKYDGERSYTNHNSLINPDTEYYYEYCVGGKTGFTDAAQRTLVTAAEKDGRTLICVTMKTPDKSDYSDQKRLYSYGFDNFTRTELPGGGVVVMPTGMDTSPFNALTDEIAGGKTEAISASNSLYRVTSSENGDKINIKYIYSDLPVGSAVIEKPKEESVVESVIETAAGSDLQAGGGREGTGSGQIERKGSAAPVLLILFAVLIGAIAAAGIWYKRQLEKQRRAIRERRRQMRKDGRDREKE